MKGSRGLHGAGARQLFTQLAELAVHAVYLLRFPSEMPAHVTSMKSVMFVAHYVSKLSLRPKTFEKTFQSPYQAKRENEKRGWG